MGTRSTIKFYDEDEFICAVYQQFDGYIDGVGKQVVDFISSKSFVNGIGRDENVFNGYHCFIAQFISNFKTSAGGLYMTSKDDEQEFNYIVKKQNKKIIISCIEESQYGIEVDIVY